MASSLNPAFGKADLSNCENELIHLAGSIQPHGALLLAREPDHVIVQASANAATFLNLGNEILGRPLAELGGDLAEQVQKTPLPEDGVPVAVRCHLGAPVAEFDGLLHRPAGGGLVVELERAGPPVDLDRHVQKGLQRILAASSMRTLADEVTLIMKDLAGYDRVMLYRFDEDGHGEVFAEEKEAHLEPYLGIHYPSSDIPQMARRLYERNRVRVLVDIDYQPVPLKPRRSPISGQDLDMSHCFLRSMSPIHIQYLKNMGVRATLVISLMVGGKLWGLIACHHYSPKFVHYEMRVVCELLAEAIGTRIAALESFAQAQAELSVRRLEQRMIDAISREGDWRAALFDGSQSLVRPVNASGAALLFEDQVMTTGDVPGTRELRELRAWLDERPRGPVFETASLGQSAPQFASWASVASGLIAAPISTTMPGEYLVWFRPERMRLVTWGGDPNQPVIVGDDPSQLSPRRSFEQWHQLVQGTSEPFSASDLAAARLIGDSVADVVLQFRSVRLLIAQDQLRQVGREVQRSDQPVVIADPEGRLLLVNEPFLDLLGPDPRELRFLEDLPRLFTNPDEVLRSLKDLRSRRRAWRGEARLAGRKAGERPLLVRADPVFASPERVLGFVLLFADLSQQKAAEAARRRFQESVIDRHQALTVPLDSRGDLIYRNLMSSLVGNAQLAALEITDGVDLGTMAGMLDSVQASVLRSSELLEQLIWHAARTSEDEPPDS